MVLRPKPTMKYRSERNLKDMIHRANLDTDAASCYVNGESWDDCDGVVIIVKGREAAFHACNILAHHGMRTPDKPIPQNVEGES